MQVEASAAAAQHSVDVEQRRDCGGGQGGHGGQVDDDVTVAGEDVVQDVPPQVGQVLRDVPVVERQGQAVIIVDGGLSVGRGTHGRLLPLAASC